MTATRSITEEIERWRWNGYVLNLSPTGITRVAFRWTPGGWRARDKTE